MSHYEWPKSVLFLRRSCILLTLPRGMVKISGLLKAFLHPSYIATRNDESGVILYLMLHMIKTFLTMTYLMALMCSLVDGLRVLGSILHMSLLYVTSKLGHYLVHLDL